MKLFPVYLFLSVYALYHCVENAPPMAMQREQPLLVSFHPHVMNEAINEQAPVVERQDILIQASPEKVWAVLADIDRWPDWQSSVSSAKLQGALREGAVFNWKAGGIGITSQLHTVTPSSAIGWTGKTLGAYAVHNWRIIPQAGGTLVQVEESLQGILPKLFRKKFAADLQKGMVKNLAELKAAAEL